MMGWNWSTTDILNIFPTPYASLDCSPEQFSVKKCISTMLVFWIIVALMITGSSEVM